jgi:hypothetical protein
MMSKPGEQAALGSQIGGCPDFFMRPSICHEISTLFNIIIGKKMLANSQRMALYSEI